MVKQNPSRTSGRYLYAIVTADAKRDFSIMGIDDQRVYTISDKYLCAVVSNVPNKKIRPQRRNIAAHQQILKHLMTETTPLPMAFGIIADGDAAVQKILTNYHDLFLTQFKRVSGKVEMGLRVAWDVDNIFNYFIIRKQLWI